jgi:hypothetical protein
MRGEKTKLVVNAGRRRDPQRRIARVIRRISHRQILFRPPRNVRDRDAHCWAPPAQIRAAAIYALGAHLGCVTLKRCAGQGRWMRARGSQSATSFASLSPRQVGLLAAPRERSPPDHGDMVAERPQMQQSLPTLPDPARHGRQAPPGIHRIAETIESENGTLDIHCPSRPDRAAALRSHSAPGLRAEPVKAARL